MNEYGHIIMNIEQILKNKGISKNKICKELDIPRPNFNRYCKNSFQRIDANLICKLCYYLECNIEELVNGNGLVRRSFLSLVYQIIAKYLLI